MKKEEELVKIVERKYRYTLVSIGGLLVKLDKETGRTWKMDKGDLYWFPIQTKDEI